MTGSAMRRARLQHLFSYLIISMIPILLCGCLLIHSNYLQRRREVEQTTLAGLGLLRDNYDQLLQSIDISASHFHGFVSGATPSDIATQLAVYKANYPNLHEIIYYPKGSANIIDVQGVHSYESFQKRLPGDVDLDMSSMFVNLNASINPSIFRVRSGQAERRNGDYLVFLQPVPVLSANPQGVLTFFLPVEDISSHLESFIGYPQALYVLADRHLSPLYRSDDTLTTLEDKLYKLRGTGVFHGKVDGESYVFMRLLNENVSMHHLIAFPEKTLFADALAERGLLLSLLVGVLLLTGLAAYALHRYIYHPIQQLLEEPMPAPEAEEGVRDIYVHVRNRMRDVAVQNNLLSEQIEDQRLLMRQQTLHNLICGYVDRGGEAHLATIGMTPLAAWYTVAYVVLYLEEEE